MGHHKEYKRQHPDGPQPIATFDMTTPEGIKAANKAIGMDALEHAFGPDGTGVDEIIANCSKEGEG